MALKRSASELVTVGRQRFPQFDSSMKIGFFKAPLLLIPIWLGLIALLPTQFSHAEQRELKTEQSEKVDAVLLLDSSGSMRITDPGHLRDEGAKLFIQFLKPGDRLAIVAFSDSTKLIRPLSDYDSAQSDAISKDIAAVGDAGQYTDLAAGVKAAKDLLDQNKREDATPVIILLSDGKMDPAPSAGAPQTLTADLINKVLPDLKAEGVKVHTLAFSDQTDKDLLSEIAVGTEGSHYFTPDADKIHESYANLFVAVKKPQMLPLTSKGFKIDADIEEATFYINRENGAQIQILTPSGKQLDAETKQEGLKWFKGQKFDVITIEKPEVGDWKVLGLPTSDGFATVLTNLKLVTDWPASLNLGSPILLQARLYESEKPIILPEMTEAIRYAFQVVPTDKVSEPILREALYDDGTHGDKIANDGIFSYEMSLEDAGEYKLQIVAQAPTFERRQLLPFRAKPRVVTLSVTSGEGGVVEDGHGADKAKGGDSFLVELSSDASGYKGIEIKVVAVDKNHKRFVLPAASAGDSSTYRAGVNALPHDGEYEVQAFLSAEGKKKGRVREESNAVQYNKVTAEGHEDTEVHVVVEEKPAEPDSPLVPLLILTLLNAAAGAGGFLLMKKAQGNATIKVPNFESLDDLNKAIAELEAAAGQSEIDINDARLSDENIAKLELRGIAGLSGASAAATSTPPAAAAATEEKPAEPGAGEPPAAESEPAQAEAAPEAAPAEEDAPKEAEEE